MDRTTLTSLKRRINPHIVFSLLLASLFTVFSTYAALHLVNNTNASGAGSADSAVAAANLDGSGSV